METELKSCPFCGGKVSLNYDLDLTPDSVHCPTCHMVVKFTRIVMENKDTFGDVIERIATAWNHRATYRSY